MRIKVALFLVAELLVGTLPNVAGQSSPAQSWTLPKGTAVKDSGPRTYRFTVDYDTADTKGDIVHRQRVIGEYTHGLPNGEVAWKNVTVADAAGATAAFPAGQKRDFMEGFHYRDDLASTMKQDFFKGFPPTAVVERNLVWDTGMIEMYGQNHFDHLKLNEPYHAGSNADVNMPDVGTFHIRDTVLEWIGRSQRDGKDCALIRYQSFFNPLQINNGGMTLQGRSDYWGEIWVSLATRQIEYATLYEEVTGEMKTPGQQSAQALSVFRIGTFEPVTTR